MLVRERDRERERERENACMIYYMLERERARECV